MTVECQGMNTDCHRVREVRLGGMAPVSDTPQSHRLSRDSGAGRIGVPSTGLSLGRLLASRADLRFTRREGDSESVSRKQEQTKVAGQEAWQSVAKEWPFFVQ